MGSLFVDNFAGLHNVVFEENRRFTILIGPQASGKSVIAKLLYFFHGIISLSRISLNPGIVNEIEKRVEERFLLLFPRSLWSDGGFTIAYTVKQNCFKIVFSGGDLSSEIPEEFKSSLMFYEKEYQSIKSRLEKSDRGDDSHYLQVIASSTARRAYQHHIKKLGFVVDNQFFVVAGRSFYSEVQDSIFEFSARNFEFERVLMESFSLFSMAKSYYSPDFVLKSKRNPSDEVVRGLIQKILHANYTQEKSKDILTHSDGRKVELKNSSSGQQETFPLLMVLYYVFNYVSRSSTIDRDGVCLFIEEPEAHIFPSSQKKIVELISFISNCSRFSKSRLSIVITTHSPYIMTSFNNLIEGDNVIRKDETKADDVCKVIGEKTSIPFEDVSAYYVGDGKIHSLMDEENRLINPSELDDVSSIIGKEFDDLLAL